MKSLKYIYQDDYGVTFFDPYFEYLRQIEADMPEPMRSFALDIGRYELNVPRTLHMMHGCVLSILTKILKINE